MNDLAVIFDMDGVVVDSEPLTIRSYLQAFEEFGVHVPREEYIRRVVVEGSRVSALFRDSGGNPNLWPDVFGRKTEMYVRLVKTEMRMMPGAMELLADLKRNGIPCALGTSAARPTMNIVFERFGLFQYFDVTVTLDEVSSHKPDPEVFLKASELMHMPPGRCVVIEDAPKGIFAAKAAGMRCVAVPTFLTVNEDLSAADLMVGSLEQLDTGILRSLVAGGGEIP